jgi:hypothetical protein
MTPEQEKRKIREAQVDIVLAILACAAWCWLCLEFIDWLFL